MRQEMRVEWTSYTSPVGPLTVVESAAGPLVVDYPARAAAVRKHLVDSYGIDGARLEAKGLGATKPVGPNDTPEGRQSNRRVELVKL